MRHLLATAALLAFATPALAAEVGGSYSVTGTNINGTEYEGTAEITVISNSTCAISWTTGSGSASEGICMLLDSAFAAGYVLDGQVGLIIYQVDDEGVLDGVWTIAGQDGAGTETLTPM